MAVYPMAESRGEKASEKDMCNGDAGAAAASSSSFALPRFWMVLLSLVCLPAAAVFSGSFNVLKILSSDREYSALELQFLVSGFCLSPIVPFLMNDRENQPNMVPVGNSSFTFEETGNINEDDYNVASIYSILYALYKNTPELTSPHGVKYQFTFNTWGFAPSPYPVEDPERHGKAAYAGLVTQPAAKEYMATVVNGTRPVQIVEIGCGTAAGANLITREVLPNSQYLALDMQMAAINTCRERHATADNPGLECRQVPGGVGGGGAGDRVPREDNSVDFVVISETHIADERIGDMEKLIFQEIYRILRPGGLFLWGNALPTQVWLDGMEYLPSAGFALVDNFNHTAGAVVARDEDKPRVDMILTQLLDKYPVMELPYFGPRCRKVSERLIANFYRHPGTALYLNMVTGFDSYMHQAWRKL